MSDTALKSNGHYSGKPSRTSTVALICGCLCVAAYLWPVLHVLGRTYEGIESVMLPALLLTPTLPLGTICGIAALALSDSGSATSHRAKRALMLIWIVPLILLVLLFVLASAF